MKSIEYIDRKSGEILQETVPGERWLRWLYHDPKGRLALNALVKRKVLSSFYGMLMDAPSSCSKIPEFVKSLGIDMSEAIRPVGDYDSFNDFFIRTLKPGARPIDTSPRSIVSPADGKVLAFEHMNGFDDFFVKGQSFNLNSFLQDAALAEKYADGTLMIFRLAPVDYHRFHFPADGRISATKAIKGAYYSVSPYAVKNMLRVYWENKREYSVLTTETAGDIVLCEVGATMVGSISQNYTPNVAVKKGQEKGWFTFGGSTVVMLLEKGKAKVDGDILANTRKGYESTIKLGERVAKA